MIGAFKADFTAANPLNISYSLKQDDYKISIFPLFPTDLANNVDDFQKVKNFKIDKPEDYFIRVVIEGENAQSDLMPKINDKLLVAKTETKSDESIHVSLKTSFRYLNLVKLSKLLVPHRELL